MTDSGAIGCSAALDPLLPPRAQVWRTSHLFSFRGELLSDVPEDYFRDARGDWLTASCDMALAFPVLDQTRRYTFLPVVAYRYTASNPNSHHNVDPHAHGLNSTRQRACAREVHSKPALPCTRPARMDPMEAWSFLGLMRSLQGPPRVLEIGAGPRAGPIAAIAHGLGGAFWSVTAEAGRAEALARALSRSPETRRAAVLTTAHVKVDYRGVHCQFPDLGVLGDQKDFNVVAISWDPTWTNEGALVSLPVVTNLLVVTGVR